MTTTHSTGMNRTVSVKLPRLPARKVHASHYPGPSQHRSSSKLKEGTADLDRVIPSEGGNHRHVCDRKDRSDHPDIEKFAPEPISLCRPRARQEEPETKLWKVERGKVSKPLRAVTTVKCRQVYLRDV